MRTSVSGSFSAIGQRPSALRSSVPPITIVLAVFALAILRSNLMAQEAQERQIEAITAAFKKLDMTAE
jgi:hypothetical protein